MKRVEDIIQFIKDPNLIGGDLSPYQETALRLFYGLALTKKQKTIAKQALDTDAVPKRQFNEATFVCGRRSGKSDRLAANLATFEAVMGQHEEHLTAGERGHVVLSAQDKRACRVLYRYILAKFEKSPLLSQLLQDVRKEEIDRRSRRAVRPESGCGPGRAGDRPRPGGRRHRTRLR